MEPHSRKIVELIDKFITKNSLVLDVGCGTGINTARLKRKTKNIVGLDIKNYVKNEYRKHFRFCIGDGMTIPFADGYFDFVTCWDVIEHIKKDKRFLKEIYRVLKKDGILLLSTPNRNRLSNRILNKIKKIEYPYFLGSNDGEVGEICHIREYSLEEIREIGERADFKVLDAEGVYLGLHGFVRKGFYRVPKSLQDFSQHLFIVFRK